MSEIAAVEIAAGAPLRIGLNKTIITKAIMVKLAAKGFKPVSVPGVPSMEDLIGSIVETLVDAIHTTAYIEAIVPIATVPPTIATVDKLNSMVK